FNRNDRFSQEKSKKKSNPIVPKGDLQPQMDSQVQAQQRNFDFADGFGQKETTEFNFKFKFPTYEEFSQSRREIEDSISSEAALDMGTTNDEFIEESEALSISPKELNTDCSEGQAVREEDNEQDFDSWNNLKGEGDDVSDEIQFFKTENDSFADFESTSSSPPRSVMNRLIDSFSDGFLSDGDFGGEFEVENLKENVIESDEETSSLDETHFDQSGKENKEDDFEKDDAYTVEELRKLEENYSQNAGKMNSDFLSDKDFHADKENSKSTDECEKVNSTKKGEWDSDDSTELETLWEHQELIEQLKMELKKVRATGLPTILEESESPKIMEDLKPWKISEKFQHEDRMDELHKFYKSYGERMRKFDILNYQKMYAIGFLQLKDPLQSISSQKSSVPSVSSLLSESFSLCGRKKIGSDPTMKFAKELQGDLEVVYVGQMCLSWEILHWQYGKALELWESDARGVRRYSEVAGQFQQFQVLLQRFVEDEPFQGPRVQNYVKSRCVLRNLLQVPVITDDSAYRKKAMKKREMGEYAITSDTLVEIMEESIRIFWRFVRADKDCSNVVVKCRKGPRHLQLHDPADSQLLMEVRANLLRKEKKLKELLRSGNCLLRKFKKREEEGSEQVLYFFSQVDMKLVGRVLNMSKLTTDQLLWCRNKLTKICFVNRQIRVEPSFWLFPC
ncbi:hypothetical protein U1Q18_038519, partial [Sarracenia purpurea var. burkii]